MTGQDFHPTEEGMKLSVDFFTCIDTTDSIQENKKPTSSDCCHDKKLPRSKRPYDPASKAKKVLMQDP